jgi:hypothetical protein
MAFPLSALENGETAAISVPGLKIFIETEAWNPPETGRGAVDGVNVVKWRQQFLCGPGKTASWCRRLVGRKRHDSNYMIYNAVSAI